MKKILSMDSKSEGSHQVNRRYSCEISFNLCTGGSSDSTAQAQQVIDEENLEMEDSSPSASSELPKSTNLPVEANEERLQHAS